MSVTCRSSSTRAPYVTSCSTTRTTADSLSVSCSTLPGSAVPAVTSATPSAGAQTTSITNSTSNCRGSVQAQNHEPTDPDTYSVTSHYLHTHRRPDMRSP